jgi:hypothetical protein
VEVVEDHEAEEGEAELQERDRRRRHWLPLRSTCLCCCRSQNSEQ